MQTSFETVSPVTVRLSADFSGEDTQAAFDEAFKLFARQTAVPGFRPGKAPKNLVLRKIGKDVRAYAREVLVSRGLSAAAKECGRTILGESEASEPEFKEGEPITFSLLAHVEPEIASLPEWKGLELDCPPPEVSPDKAVDDAVAGMLDRAGTFEDEPAADYALAMKDMASVSWEATFEGKPLLEIDPEAKEIARNDGMWFLLDETYAPLPEFVPALVGMKAGEEKDVTAAFPGRFKNETLRDKAIDFLVKVLKIRRHVPAKMDEAFFQRVGCKDEAELRKLYRDMFDSQALGRLRELHRKAIASKLLEDAPEAPLPRTMRCNRMLLEELLLALARSRAPVDVIRKRFAELQGWMEDIAEKVSRAITLLLAIARAENIAPAHAAIHARMEDAARVNGHSTVKAWLKHLDVTQETLHRIVEEELTAEMAIARIAKHARFTGERAPAAADLYADESVVPAFGTITFPFEMLFPAPESKPEEPVKADA